MFFGLQVTLHVAFGVPVRRYYCIINLRRDLYIKVLRGTACNAKYTALIRDVHMNCCTTATQIWFFNPCSRHWKSTKMSARGLSARAQCIDSWWIDFHISSRMTDSDNLWNVSNFWNVRSSRSNFNTSASKTDSWSRRKSHTSTFTGECFPAHHGSRLFECSYIGYKQVAGRLVAGLCIVTTQIVHFKN